MIRDLKTKPDFAKTVERFEAWWHGEIVDRTPVSLSVQSDRPDPGPQSRHRTLRERWLDAEFAVESFVARLEGAEFLGDTFPVFWPNVGPEITATLFGCELEFSETTSWSRPIVHRAEEWERIWSSPANFENVYWQTIERMTDLAIERCDGRYIVGMTDLHGNYDILAALRDPQTLCMDLLDCPELVQRAGRHVAQGFVGAFHRSYRKLAAAGFGSTTWLPTYHEGPAYVPSSDFWCMVSPTVAREMVLPDILTEMQPLERSIFHLDGPQALPHLDLLLALPQLHAVQWVYGAGQGPAARWTEVYRRIRRAGKSLQLVSVDAADALAVLEQIGTRGVWVTVGTPFESTAEAEAFLRQVGKCSGDIRV
jgi:hypothetical protein